MEAAHFQPSAFSVQLLNKFCNFGRFTEQNFFAKCKEVTDKESITLDMFLEGILYLSAAKPGI